MAQVNKQVTQPVDDYLRFIQYTFNTEDINFNSILKELEEFNKAVRPIMDERIAQAAIRAEQLREKVNRVDIIKDVNKYAKFNKLSVPNLDNTGVVEVYKASEEIIKDIQVARDWLDSYKEFRKVFKDIKTKDALHTDLLTLGKSILGRAIELAPIKTGTLRRSGAVFDYGNYIIIAFTAPYATYVHENMEIAHPIHASNPNCSGRAKFLEIALQEFFPNRSVWTEIHGYNGVMVKIGINPLWLEYSHYS